MNRLKDIAAAAEPRVEERFLLPLTRSELELFAIHAGSLYAIETARTIAPEMMVLTSEGPEKYPEFMARLAGQQLAGAASRFLNGRSIEQLRELVNRFQVLQGEPKI